MRAWLDRILYPKCAGCGTELETWTDQTIQNGYLVEQKWTGCPRYRTAELKEMRRHTAWWRQGKIAALREQP